MQIRNTKLVEKVKLGFIITLGIFLMFFVTVAKAQDFRYEVGLETSKDWSNVVLPITSNDIEINGADKVLVSSNQWEDQIINNIIFREQDRVDIVLMRKKDLRKLRKSGETFTLDFYNKGELIYKVIGVPTKGQTQFFYQEIGVYWVGNFSS